MRDRIVYESADSIATLTLDCRECILMLERTVGDT